MVVVEGDATVRFCSLLSLAMETSNKRLDLALRNRAGLAAPREGARLELR